MDIPKIKEELKNTKVETERKRRLRKLIISEIISFIILIAGFCLCKYLNIYYGLTNATWILDLNTLFIKPIFVIALVFLFWYPFWANKDFKDYLKGKCEDQILKLFNLTKRKADASANTIDKLYNEYNEKIKICTGQDCDISSLIRQEKDLKESNLFSDFTHFENDDIFTGHFEDVTYNVAETTIAKGCSKIDSRIFKGVIITLPANKKFKTKTVITTNGDINITNNFSGLPIGIILLCIPFLVIISLFFNTLSGANLNSSYGQTILAFSITNILICLCPVTMLIISAILYHKKKEKFEKAKTEDIVFDKRFKIHAQDQIEARYLVTTGFMERLNELKLAFGTKNIKCSFFDDKIMIAIQTNRDLFEIGSLYKPCPTNEDIKRFYHEMLAIQKLIMHLKLTNKTGL
ncbi:DUF3137 domain-containing protein [bacterium]|nr:DUF3137 domain-containing protein [bacterium]